MEQTTFFDVIQAGKPTREIKFRAWDNKEKIYHRVTGIEWEYPGGPIKDWDRRMVFEQFTGIYDKNKKEIYEGDVVRAYIYTDEEPVILPVYFSDGGFFIDYKNSDNDIYLLGYFPGIIEIIGNIHEGIKDKA